MSATSPTPREIESAALALSRTERAELARRLIESLDEEGEITTAWQDEARRRIDNYRKGLLNDVAAEDVFADARKLSQP